MPIIPKLNSDKPTARAIALAVGCSFAATLAMSQETIRLQTSSGSIAITGPSPVFDTIAIGDGGAFASAMGGLTVEAQLLEDGRIDDVVTLRRISAALSGNTEVLECNSLPDTMEKPVPLCSPSNLVLIYVLHFDDIRSLGTLARLTSLQTEELIGVVSSPDRSPILSEFCNSSSGFGALEEASRTGHSITCRGSNQDEKYLPFPLATRLFLSDEAAVMISVQNTQQTAETQLEAMNQIPTDQPLSISTFYPAYNIALSESETVAVGALEVANSITVEFIDQ